MFGQANEQTRMMPKKTDPLVDGGALSEYDAREVAESLYAGEANTLSDEMLVHCWPYELRDAKIVVVDAPGSSITCKPHPINRQLVEIDLHTRLTVRVYQTEMHTRNAENIGGNTHHIWLLKVSELFEETDRIFNLAPNRLKGNIFI